MSTFLQNQGFPLPSNRMQVHHTQIVAVFHHVRHNVILVKTLDSPQCISPKHTTHVSRGQPYFEEQDEEFNDAVSYGYR
jgi:hypothetical protein